MKTLSCVVRSIGIPRLLALLAMSLAFSAFAQVPIISNLPPAVRILTPTNNTVFPAPAMILICAEALDRDGYVATVEFFAGTNSLGVRTNNPLSTGPMNPFCLTWSNVPPGTYLLTARATDNLGAQQTSLGVRVFVGVPPQTVVTVVATDPIATEPGLLTVIDPGIFTLHRTGPTNNPLRVFYWLGGTASNGVDYVELPLWADIPAGSAFANVMVVPKPDNLVEGRETVVLRVLAPVCPAIFPPPPECYLVGNPAEAVVTIVETNQPPPPTNYPPVVRITSPANGAVFRAPVNLPLFGYARDRDDAVATVEFFDGTNSLGFGQPLPVTITNPPPLTVTNTRPVYLYLYGLMWSNAPVGPHILTAQATDTRGASAVSQPVRILVEPVPPPPTNRPPVVTIVALDPIAIEGTNCWVYPVATNTRPTWTNWPAAACVLYTNCGPKNALFAVRRAGATNESLTVPYDMGGTATNGVHYVPLPGEATFQPGERAVLIPIVPVEDQAPDITRTVILRLRPSTNLPPDYVLGTPARAAAIIVDSNRPRPLTGLLPDRCFYLTAAGPNGAWFRVEFSTDMQRWGVLCTNQVFEGTIGFIDPDADKGTRRFYRAVPLADMPVE